MTVSLTAQLAMPNAAHLFDQVCLNAPWALRMAEAGSRAGQRVVICAAGPSLADLADQLPDADEVWACNSALPYLLGRGVRVTHGITIDHGEGMLADHEFGGGHDVAYYLASGVFPGLVQRLAGCGRTLTFFHSWIGTPAPAGWAHADPAMDFEQFCYRRLYKPSVCLGRGLNTGVRAVGLAVAMGFDEILVVGNDCAARPDAPPMPDPRDPAWVDWLGELVLYADGRTARCYGDDGPIAEAVFEGRRWHTRPDMLVSAVHLLELMQESPGRIRLLGDGLPQVFLREGPAILAELPALAADGQVLNFALHEALAR
ncbi:MAG: DUF115 domain-containing protein [Gemmatimonadetes bacterium]|nr:DUF115 domain-containing protein [Gemmatimonadota bacterium]